MGLEEGKKLRPDYTPEQEKKYDESRERFGLRVSNAALVGKSVPREGEQMAAVQTHAIFEKYLRLELQKMGVQMREDDLQKIMSASSEGFSTISHRVTRKTNTALRLLPWFNIKPFFGAGEEQDVYSDEDVKELSERYPIDKLREASFKAWEDTRLELKREEGTVTDRL